jgi:hypothetical protein
VDHVQLAVQAQQFDGEAGAAAIAGGCIAQAAGAGLGALHEVGEGVDAGTGVDHQREGRVVELRNRCEVLDGVIGKVLLGAGKQSVGADRADQQRVAIGLGPGDGLGANDAARTCAVLDHDRLASCSPRALPTRRAMMSATDPGDWGTTRTMGFSGNSPHPLQRAPRKRREMPEWQQESVERQGKRAS